MDSSNTIKEFFENQGDIKMELNTISGLAIAGVIDVYKRQEQEGSYGARVGMVSDESGTRTRHSSVYEGRPCPYHRG